MIRNVHISHVLFYRWPNYVNDVIKYNLKAENMADLVPINITDNVLLTSLILFADELQNFGCMAPCATNERI